MKKVLITGVAGFIGYHLAKSLLKKKIKVIGVDNLNSYYSVKLKKDRLSNLKNKNFIFIKCDIKNLLKLKIIFKKYNPSYIIHLAAQAGVRFSLKNPKNYLENNVFGFFNILEICKEFKIRHLVYASSSSVYGNSKKAKLNINDKTSKPLSFYAFTKKSNELMAYTYSNLHNIKTTGLRLFTVYGPWGRPDMSLHKFASAIIDKKTIEVFNYGKHKRSFTFISDAINQIKKITFKKPKKKFNIFNIGGGETIKLTEYIKIIEKNLNTKAKQSLIALQKGDVQNTTADIKLTINETNYKPKTKIELGIKKSINWFLKYYKIK